MAQASSDSRNGQPFFLTAYVGAVAVSSVILSALLIARTPYTPFTPSRWLGLITAALVLHVLNQINFTIRFSGQPDNVELTFTEAALVALFFAFQPGPVVLISGLAHFVRELQAHRRRRVQVVFNTAEILLSLSLAGFVFNAVHNALPEGLLALAFIAAMLTHSVVNRLLVGTVISLNAGHFHPRYYKSLFVDNIVMLFMNLALGMTAVMAFLLGQPFMLWVPFCILVVVYIGYQAYVEQLRDSNTFARLYENALVAGNASEAELIPMALSKVLDTFGSREASLVMTSAPGVLGRWRLRREQRLPDVERLVGSLRNLDGAEKPLRLVTDEPAHARAWRRGSRYNAMIAPVQYEGQLMGVLRAEKPRAWDSFTPGDLRAFSLFARHFGIALENARLLELDREQQRLRQRALDAERNRISRDLHDSFVQTLVQVDLHLAYLVGLVEKRPADAPEEIASLQENVREGLAEARSYMAELKPLRIEPGEFLAVAQRYLDDFSRQYHVQTELCGDERPLDLTADDLTELFQIVREALNNVAKHAQARNVTLSVSSDATHVITRIQDNGIGFDMADPVDLRRQGHFGLSNICERANGMGGIVYWDSAPGKGTSVTVRIPRRMPSDVLKGVPA